MADENEYSKEEAETRKAVEAARKEQEAKDRARVKIQESSELLSMLSCEC